jgi:transcriptional regulator
MDKKQDLLQGTLDVLILKIVALGPIHGYGIAQRINQISKEVLQVQQGSLYPALHRLENREWLTAEWRDVSGREAKFYTLTRAGRKQLQTETQNWERLSDAVSLILRPPSKVTDALDQGTLRTTTSRARARQGTTVSHRRTRRRKIAEGIAPPEARRRAILELGGPAQIKEDCRDVRLLHWLEVWLADLRYGFRGLRSSPAFTLTAVLSIALGIGANATIFTLLTPHCGSRYRCPSRNSCFICSDCHRMDGPAKGDIRGSCTTRCWMLAGRMATCSRRRALPCGSSAWTEASRIGRGRVRFREFLRRAAVGPFLGRTFEPQDDSVLGGRPVAVLSHAFWQRRFGSDPGVLGKTVLYEERPFTIVGVARPGFQGVDAESAVDIWTTITATAPKEWLTGPIGTG